jgi:hypothetical protein
VCILIHKRQYLRRSIGSAVSIHHGISLMACSHCDPNSVRASSPYLFGNTIYRRVWYPVLCVRICTCPDLRCLSPTVLKEPRDDRRTAPHDRVGCDRSHHSHVANHTRSNDHLSPLWPRVHHRPLYLSRPRPRILSILSTMDARAFYPRHLLC